MFCEDHYTKEGHLDPIQDTTKFEHPYEFSTCSNMLFVNDLVHCYALDPHLVQPASYSVHFHSTNLYLC